MKDEEERNGRILLFFVSVSASVTVTATRFCSFSFSALPESQHKSSRESNGLLAFCGALLSHMLSPFSRLCLWAVLSIDHLEILPFCHRATTTQFPDEAQVSMPHSSGKHTRTPHTGTHMDTHGHMAGLDRACTHINCLLQLYRVYLFGARGTCCSKGNMDVRMSLGTSGRYGESE